ncbi:hypothetical protein C0J52_14459 [Blattella germanica]|nr:hypothetical protein C0J52_14459 [Blattella germanica]
MEIRRLLPTPIKLWITNMIIFFLEQGFLKSTPKTTAEFLKQWQPLEGNDRFHFLKKMGAKNVKELFKYELPVGLLGQILHAFLLVLPSEAPDIAFMIKLMDSLTGTKR